jgi:chromosome segregation ATPase
MYWQPMLVALILGILLGWLFLGWRSRSKAGRLEAQVGDLEGKAKRAERELADARKQADSLKASAATAESALADARKQLSTAEESLTALQQEKDALVADTQSRAIELADAKMQLALQQDQAQSLQGMAASEVEELRGRLDALTAERDGLARDLAGLKDMAAKAETDLAKVQAITAGSAIEIANKDAALNEAYQRVVNLQRIVEEREAAQANAQAELTVVKSELAAAQALREDLDTKLQRARGDVASEMAVLTSTMFKMKDDALTAANQRIADLTRQVNELKSKQAAG